MMTTRLVQGVVTLSDRKEPSLFVNRCKRRKSERYLDYPVFDHKSDEAVLIGLIPGSTAQSNAGLEATPVGVLVKGTDLAWFFGGVACLPKLQGGHAHVFVLAATLRDVSVKGVENRVGTHSLRVT
jgi:hypothetical protein